jgi:hypothetical protein
MKQLNALIAIVSSFRATNLPLENMEAKLILLRKQMDVRDFDVVRIRRHH